MKKMFFLVLMATLSIFTLANNYGQLYQNLPIIFLFRQNGRFRHKLSINF